MNNGDRIVSVGCLIMLVILGLMAGQIARFSREAERARFDTAIARASEAEAWRLVQELRATLSQYQDP
jgi:hypothetical protein